MDDEDKGKSKGNSSKYKGKGKGRVSVRVRVTVTVMVRVKYRNPPLESQIQMQELLRIQPRFASTLSSDTNGGGEGEGREGGVVVGCGGGVGSEEIG